jgi:hypothetical protein
MSHREHRNRRVFQGLENCGAFFPSLGNFVAEFSKPWKKIREISCGALRAIQCLEKPLVPVSNAWKRCNWVAQGFRPSMFDVRFSGFGFAGSETRLQDGVPALWGSRGWKTPPTIRQWTISRFCPFCPISEHK